MKNDLNLNRYYKDVEKSLKCSKKEKRHIIDNLKSDIEAYLEEVPDATDIQICEKFGKPEQYAEEYLANIEQDDLKKKVRLNRIGLKFWIIAAIIMILIFIGVIIYFIIWNDQTEVKYYSEEIAYDISIDQSENLDN